MEHLRVVKILIFGALLIFGSELTQLHEYLFPGYNIVVAIVGCTYFIAAIRVLRIIQKGVSQ